MAQSRYYSSTAQPTTLSASMNASQTTAALTAVVGFPATTPYVLALGYGTATEELVLVNTIAGTNLTSITRGFDGTAASSHTAGDAVRHVWCGMDGNDSRAHEGAANLVHGITGNVVGTTDTQTLSNKTLTTPTINTPTVSGGTFSGNPTFSGSPLFQTGTPAFNNGFNAGSTGQLVVSNTGVVTAGTVNGNIPITTTNTTAAFQGGAQFGSTAQLAVSNAGVFTTDVSFNAKAIMQASTGTFTTYANNTPSTYVPTVTGQGTATFTTQVGTYYKIGKMVFVIIHLVVNAAGSGATNVAVTAPTTIDGTSSTHDTTFTAHFQAGSTFAGYAVKFAGSNSSTIDRIRMQDGGATDVVTNLTGVKLTTGSIVNITGWYMEA